MVVGTESDLMLRRNLTLITIQVFSSWNSSSLRVAPSVPLCPPANASKGEGRYRVRPACPRPTLGQAVHTVQYKIVGVSFEPWGSFKKPQRKCSWTILGSYRSGNFLYTTRFLMWVLKIYVVVLNELKSDHQMVSSTHTSHIQDLWRSSKNILQDSKALFQLVTSLWILY